MVGVSNALPGKRFIHFFGGKIFIMVILCTHHLTLIKSAESINKQQFNYMCVSKNRGKTTKMDGL